MHCVMDVLGHFGHILACLGPLDVIRVVEVMGPKKFGGSVPPPLGEPPPLKLFLRSSLGLASCFHVHCATVGLSRFRPDFGL